MKIKLLGTKKNHTNAKFEEKKSTLLTCNILWINSIIMLDYMDYMLESVGFLKKLVYIWLNFKMLSKRIFNAKLVNTNPSFSYLLCIYE